MLGGSVAESGIPSPSPCNAGCVGWVGGAGRYAHAYSAT